MWDVGAGVRRKDGDDEIYGINVLYGKSESVNGNVVSRLSAGAEYFTDGYLTVTWLSGEGISLIETKLLPWDEPSYRR